MKIEIGKSYETRCGEVVTVMLRDGNGFRGGPGIVSPSATMSWNEDGKRHRDCEHDYDIEREAKKHGGMV